MNSAPDLLKAVRSGQLAEVRAALDAGASLADETEACLAIGIACFLGHVPIVRELARRGAQVNLSDNRAPTSPLSMAIRGGKLEAVRALVELGVQVPAGLKTGLAPEELALAKWIALHNSHAAKDPDAVFEQIEEINVERPDHLDTQLLESDIMRIARSS